MQAWLYVYKGTLTAVPGVTLNTAGMTVIEGGANLTLSARRLISCDDFYRRPLLWVDPAFRFSLHKALPQALKQIVPSCVAQHAAELKS